MFCFRSQKDIGTFVLSFFDITNSETITTIVQLMWLEKTFLYPSRVATLSVSLFSVCATQRMRSITKQISGLQERQTFIYLHMKGIISVSCSQNYSKQHKKCKY